MRLIQITIVSLSLLAVISCQKDFTNNNMKHPTDLKNKIIAYLDSKGQKANDSIKTIINALKNRIDWDDYYYSIPQKIESKLSSD